MQIRYNIISVGHKPRISINISSFRFCLWLSSVAGIMNAYSTRNQDPLNVVYSPQKVCVWRWHMDIKGIVNHAGPLLLWLDQRQCPQYVCPTTDERVAWLMSVNGF